MAQLVPVECMVCKKPFHVKPSHTKRRKCCSKQCDAVRRREMYRGERNPNYGNRGDKCAAWRGGRRIDNHGYVEILMPNHPMSKKDGYIREHRYVMAEHLGRLLEPYEDVHHIDGDRQNNDISNLQLLTRSEHTRLHNESKEIIRDKDGRILGVRNIS